MTTSFLDHLAQRPLTLWRYHELLPLPLTPPANGALFGEGFTPLLPLNRWGAQVGSPNLLTKDERQLPTGTFKDRQAATAVAYMADQGVTDCVMASAGNAAIAYAAYCARMGIRLWVFMPNTAPHEKSDRVRAYGAQLFQLPDNYDETKLKAAKFAQEKGYYLEQGAKSEISLAGLKTIAYELAEQLNWQSPDWYVQAVSGGIGPLGVISGFVELEALGLVKRIPKLAIIQIDGCAPMVQAYERGAATAVAVTPHTTIDVLATGNPGAIYTRLYHYVQQYGGTMISVTEQDAWDARDQLAQCEGILMGRASSVAFAGTAKLLQQGVIDPKERVVINCTGLYT